MISRKPRVLIATTMALDPWGGSEELWAGSAQHLLRRECEVIVSKKAWPTVPPTLAALAAAGATVEYRQQPTLYARLLSKISPERTYERRILERYRPSMLLISMGNHGGGEEWMEAATALRVPYVVLVQSVVPWLQPSDEEAPRLKAGYLGARKVCFVSRNNQSMTESHLGCELPLAEVVQNPFGVPYDQPLPWPPEEPLGLACVARLDAYTKGHDVLLEVLSLEKWRTRPLKVTLYGKGRNERMLRRESERRGLVNLQFGGFLNPVEIWKRTHCLVLPSRAEGLPLALVEAMLCGRPCIVTDVAGNAEFVEDNRTGFVAAAPTAGALDDAMERAWCRRRELAQMGECASLAIRKLVPPDPARVFAEDLLKMVA